MSVLHGQENGRTILLGVSMLHLFSSLSLSHLSRVNHSTRPLLTYPRMYHVFHSQCFVFLCPSDFFFTPSTNHYFVSASEKRIIL